MKAFVAFLLGIVLIPLLLVQQAVAQDSYRVRAGDVLRIEVLEDPSLNRSVLVLPDGRISLPLAGSVAAAGRGLEDVQADIVARLQPSFATSPSVFVGIERLAEREISLGGTAAPAEPPGIEIFVIGEAAKSGKIRVTPGTTMLQLFAEIGGFSKFAATKRIQLRRADASGKEKIYLFNYKEIERGTSDAGNTVIAEGDIIVVPQRGLFE